MREWLASLLRRIVGRINEMRLVRDFCLIVLAILFALTYPLISEALNSKNWAELVNILKDNPLIIIIMAMPFIGLGVLMFFIHQIDKWEDAKANKRHNELLDTIKNNRPIIFNRRMVYGKHKRHTV